MHAYNSRQHPYLLVAGRAAECHSPRSDTRSPGGTCADTKWVVLDPGKAYNPLES